MALPRYRETLRWSFWIWFFFLFLLGSLSIAVWAALGVQPAIVVSLIEFALLLVFYFKSGLHIEVDDGWLYVGNAKIELQYVAAAIELDPAAMRRVRGPEADPAAYLAIRFWVSAGIKVMVNDARDKTPYWLISTKQSAQLASAINNRS